MSAIIQQMRIHQWIKNILIAIPVILAHKTNDTSALLSVVVAFVSFSMIASAVYTMNDLADAESDARHPDKCNRPIPSGRLSTSRAIMLMISLFVVGCAIAVLYLPFEALQWITLYIVLNIVYSFWLREKEILDVLVLGLFYTLRIWLGGAVAQVPLSPWLLSFSMFLFMSLAFVKRYTELQATTNSTSTVHGRGYQPNDSLFVLVLGSSLGFIAVLVFVLYLNSPEVSKLYQHAERLWFLVPVMMYWISYLWLKAHRGEVHVDPVVFMWRDLTSYVVAGIAALVYLWAWML